MKNLFSISIISFRLTDQNRVVEDAISSIQPARTRVVLLPGCSFGTEADENESIRTLGQLAAHYGMYLFAEAGDYRLGRPDGSLYPITFGELFSTSKEATPDKVRDLISKLSTNRLLNIDNKMFALMICGENNIIRNQQSLENQPSVRHVGGQWPQPYDILLNPAHTVMGNWGKLEKRFSLFSSQNRLALFCTNNTSHSSSWRSCLRFYRNGNLIQNGDTPTSRSNDWRVLTIQI